MLHPKSNTIFFIALIFLSTGAAAAAQKIYKCGATYSQLPCPNGILLPEVSTPEAAQKTAADQATRRDTLTADRMEKSRLQQERRDLAANTPDIRRKIRTTVAQTEIPPSLKKSKTKRKEEEFRAVVPGTVTSKKHTKK